MGRWTARLETTNILDNQPRKPVELPERKASGGLLGSIGRVLGPLPESANARSEVIKPILPAPVDEDPELTPQLLETALRACDFWGDSQAARAEMVADIKATPQHLRQDLLDHFLCAYGKAK
jgi:hypothetical protein